MASPNRLAALDGLRGAMCLWVLIGHTCSQTGMHLPVLQSPHYAVDGFMILSGFLMTYHALLRSEKEPWTRPGTWLNFYIRRYFRISPLYYLLLIPAYLFSDLYLKWRLSTDRFLGLPRPFENIQHFSPVHLLMHLTYLFGLFPAYHASTVLPDWSLSLEMQFYLIFPCFMLLILRFGWTPFAVGATAIWLIANACAPHLSQPFRQPSPLPLSLLWFVIGMLWARAYLQSDRGNGQRLALLAASLALLSWDPHDMILVSAFGWILFSEGKASLGPSADFLRKLLSGKLSSFLAGASYSVYLTHLLILTPAAYILCTRFQLSVTQRFLSATAVTIAVSYGFARPLERIENWGIATGKRWCSREIKLFLPNPNPVHSKLHLGS